MDKLTKKVILNVSVTPWTIIPFVGGLSLLFLSEILGTRAVFGGLIFCLFGITSLITNILLNLNQIYTKVNLELQEEEMKNHEKELSILLNNLQSDNDSSDEKILSSVWKMYKNFKKDLLSGNVKVNDESLLNQIDQVYFSIIKHLRQQYEILKISNSLSGKHKKSMIAKREALMKSIDESFIFLSEAISEIRTLGFSTDGELTQLQQRLKSQLDTAKATEDRLAEVIGGSIEDRFKEYE